MATIKAFSDLQQSKKLAEFLPLESADFHFSANQSPQGYLEKPIWGNPEYADYNAFPCWSLAALLSVLPKEINALGTIYSINIHTKNEKWFIDYKCNNEEFVGVYSNIFLDACYEMILKLHELNLL